MTYLNCESGLSDLKPSKQRRLLFRGFLSHGPGSDEQIEWWIGHDQGGKFQVLWLKSDWCDDRIFQAAAWMTVDARTPKEAGEALLCELWTAEKELNDADGPSYDEVIQHRRALLSPKDVDNVGRMVWPEA